jgi:hypothetical protein
MQYRYTHKVSSAARFASILLFADLWSPLEHVIQALDAAGDSRTSVTGAGAITHGNGINSCDWRQSQTTRFFSLVGVCFRAHSLTQLQVVVAQGCRPVGPTHTIAAAAGNVAWTLPGHARFYAVSRRWRSKRSFRQVFLCGIRSTSPLENTNSDYYLVRQLLGFVPSHRWRCRGGATESRRQAPHSCAGQVALQDIKRSACLRRATVVARQPPCVPCKYPVSLVVRVFWCALLSSSDGAVAGFFGHLSERFYDSYSTVSRHEYYWE